MTIQTKRPLILTCIAASLLLLTLIAMHYTKEISWSPFDFLAAAILFASSILAVEMVMRNITSRPGRLILCTLILAALALIWLELAVGIFWSPFAGS